MSSAGRSVWFVTGSQHLYGPEVIDQVGRHSAEIASRLGSGTGLLVVAQPILTDCEAVSRLCRAAEADPDCAGLILWMHTFSPAKMWIGGLSGFRKPLCHLHTQYNLELPWRTIDMDFMNLNQSAHGDREAAHLHTRLGLRRSLVVGHWTDPRVLGELGEWGRVALGWAELQETRIARFGDNMRQVTVTEGDKVSAQMVFGFRVDGYGVGDLVEVVGEVEEGEMDHLVDEYEELYDVSAELRRGGARHGSLRVAARQEAGLRRFLESGGFGGFTTTFEDLYGLEQLPGLAVQRLMAAGYGFGAEGDWKTAALLRFAKVVAGGGLFGTSFMEDYTYDLTPGRELVLGAHMLEVCPSIAAGRPRVEAHPLGIGGKADPVRLVFDGRAGRAVNASLVDLGDRFRLLVSVVEAVEVPDMPCLPVARAVWRVLPDFPRGVEAWLRAGGAHHTVYTGDVSVAQWRALGEMSGVEVVVIGE